MTKVQFGNGPNQSSPSGSPISFTKTHQVGYHWNDNVTDYILLYRMNVC
jgi:hypothetical protein